MRLVIHVKLAPNDIKSHLYWIGCTTTVHSQCAGAVRNQMQVHKSKNSSISWKERKIKISIQSYRVQKKEQLHIREQGFYPFKHAIIALYPNNPRKT